MSAWLDSVNTAIDHMNEMRLEPALAVLEPLCAESLVAASSGDRMALAAAPYLKGLVLDRQGHHEAAFEAHRQCVERFGSVLDVGVQDYVARCLDSDVMGQALEVAPALVVRLPPAHHAFRLPTNLAQAGTIETELAAEPELRQQYRDSLSELILHDDARASEQHRAALQVLRAHFDQARPFGLYLRNFDIEASEKRMSDGTLLTMTTSEPGWIEARAERDLAASLPLIGLANGVNFRRDFDHAIPKLEVANELWQTVLRILATRATTVLFDYRHPSPGVAVELELLQSLGRAGETVLVVADEGSRAAVRGRWPAFTRVQLPDEPLPAR